MFLLTPAPCRFVLSACPSIAAACLTGWPEAETSSSVGEGLVCMQWCAADPSLPDLRAIRKHSDDEEDQPKLSLAARLGLPGSTPPAVQVPVSAICAWCMSPTRTRTRTRIRAEFDNSPGRQTNRQTSNCFGQLVICQQMRNRTNRRMARRARTSAVYQCLGRKWKGSTPTLVTCCISFGRTSF